MHLARWIIACTLLLAPMAAGATTQQLARIDAEALIDACWAASHDDLYSDSRLRVGDGMAATIGCLESAIDRHAAAFFDGSSVEEIRALVADLDRAYAQLYFIIFNENVGCKPSCGSAYYNVGAAALIDLLENVLRDLIDQRNFYEQ